MSADSKALYQEVILDHNRKPRNFGELSDASHHAEGVNPLCGDHIHLALDIQDDTIARIAFHGESCAICKASASMMTAAVKGKHTNEAKILIHEFVDMATGRVTAEASPHIGRLAVFSNISTLPMRVKCAILPWHTLQAAFHAEPSTSTEAEADPMHTPLGDA
jgi:nitrogen fixation NifU-like protein